MSALAPSISTRTTIFPWNEQSNTFHTQSYEPDQVSLEEVNQFISEINEEYRLYKNNLPVEKSKAESFYGLVTIIFIWDVCLLFGNSRDDFLGYFTNGEMIFLTWFLFWFARWLFGLKFDIDSLSEMKNKSQDIVDKHNENLRSRSLKWYLPDEFPAWIELTKIMEKKNNHLEIRHRVPRSTANIIVFPRKNYKSNQKELIKVWRFSQDFFSPHMVADRISCKEVREFLSEINACLKTSFEKSSKASFPILRCLIFELFVLLYLLNHIFEGFLATFIIIIIAVISVIACLCLYGYGIMKEREEAEGKGNILMKKSCQTIVNKHNETLRRQGLRWHLPDRFPHWVELCKISQNQDLKSQPISLFPENEGSPMKSRDDTEAGNRNVNKISQNNAYLPLAEDNDN